MDRVSEEDEAWKKLNANLSAEKIAAYAFPIQPEPWAMGIISIGRNKSSGKFIPIVSANPTVSAYEQAIASELERFGASLKLPLYSVRFTFSRQLISYTKLDGGTASRNQADVTNMQKATEDALQGVLIGNDRDVIRTESRMAGPQTAETDPWVLVEVRYGCTGYAFHETDLPSGISEQGLDALKNMQETKEGGDHIRDNTWEP
jgi:hypothetical protein